MPRVLIAEDDTRQADLLSRYLEAAGHDVIVCHDGRSALEKIRSRQPDLALLDVMMPEMDGLDVCRIVRRENINTAIIMLTARITEQDRVLGLDLGADDYITKPYSMNEAMARIRAVLRRTAPSNQRKLIEVGRLVIDLDRCEVQVDGVMVELTPSELNLLEALSAKPGVVMSRGKLLEAVAGYDSEALERTVDMHIANLRKKIEPTPSKPSLVVTVKGRGYKLADS